jgi:hypothetical protein
MAHHGSKTVGKHVPVITGNHVTDPHVQEIARTEASRPVNAGTGKKRGDRRDMSPTYTTNVKHAAPGNTPRKDVSTRAR